MSVETIDTPPAAPYCTVLAVVAVVTAHAAVAGLVIVVPTPRLKNTPKPILMLVNHTPSVQPGTVIGFGVSVHKMYMYEPRSPSLMYVHVLALFTFPGFFQHKPQKGSVMEYVKA